MAENCCDCNLITQADFKGVVSIPANIDGEKLNISIRESKAYVKKYICDDLWNELCQQIEDNELTTLNEILLCKLKDIWVRYAYAELLENNCIQLTTAGVVRKISDESENVSFDNASKYANKWRMYGKNYVHYLKEFLKENKDENPLYTECYCLCGGKVNDNSVQFGGIA